MYQYFGGTRESGYTVEPSVRVHMKPLLWFPALEVYLRSSAGTETLSEILSALSPDGVWMFSALIAASPIYRRNFSVSFSLTSVTIRHIRVSALPCIVFIKPGLTKLRLKICFSQHLQSEVDLV